MKRETMNSFFKKKTPNFGWLSEESLDDKSRFESDFFWCLDPIDGTRSYILGKPEYTISLALINNFKPILGIIYNPITNEYFHAEEHKGAFCNNTQIKVNTKKKFEVCFHEPKILILVVAEFGMYESFVLNLILSKSV